MSLLRDWVKFSTDMALTPPVLGFKQSDRKVVRGVTFATTLDDSLTLQHAAYAEGHANDSKLALLRRFYRNEESLAIALRDWEEVTAKGTFNSVGVSTYGAQKQGYTKQGQCMQAISLTLVRGRTEVDVFYRTADLVMRFPADLVFLRDDILPPFARLAPLGRVVAHFANATIDPRFYWLLFPQLSDPIKHLAGLRIIDPKLWNGILTSINYYLTNRRILFDRFQRQRPKFLAMLSPQLRSDLSDYIREQHRAPRSRVPPEATPE